MEAKGASMRFLLYLGAWKFLEAGVTQVPAMTNRIIRRNGQTHDGRHGTEMEEWVCRRIIMRELIIHRAAGCVSSVHLRVVLMD